MRQPAKRFFLAMKAGADALVTLLPLALLRMSFHRESPIAVEHEHDGDNMKQLFGRERIRRMITLRFPDRVTAVLFVRYCC